MSAPWWESDEECEKMFWAASADLSLPLSVSLIRHSAIRAAETHGHVMNCSCKNELVWDGLTSPAARDPRCMKGAKP